MKKLVEDQKPKIIKYRVWAPLQVIGVMLVASGIVLLVVNIIEPTPGAAAYFADHDTMSQVWSHTYDFQLEHLREMIRYGFCLSVSGMLLIWRPWRWRPGRKER